MTADTRNQLQTERNDTVAEYEATLAYHKERGQAQSVLLERLGYDAVLVEAFKTERAGQAQQVADMTAFSTNLRTEVAASKEVLEGHLNKFVELNARINVVFSVDNVEALLDCDLQVQQQQQDHFAGVGVEEEDVEGEELAAEQEQGVEGVAGEAAHASAGLDEDDSQ